MNAIKRARKFIAKNSHTEEASTLARLVLALESDEAFGLSDLYRLDYDAFNLAIEILKEWRLDRYYMSKAKLHDLAVQVREL